MNKKLIIAGVAATVLLIGDIVIFGGTSSPSADNGRTDEEKSGQIDNGRTGKPGEEVKNGSSQGSPQATSQAVGAMSGVIVTKNDTSVTIKLSNGSSKIVFFTQSTTMTMDGVAGTAASLVAGKTVIISGATNADGSVSAKSIKVETETTSRAPVNEITTAGSDETKGTEDNGRNGKSGEVKSGQIDNQKSLLILN